MSKFQKEPAMHRIQRGTALIVALILVLLATVMGLFAVNVGVFEQRASSNDVRARLVGETAETAISQGMAYFDALPEKRHRDPVIWEKCAANDDTFPCGTVPRTFDWPGATVKDPLTGVVTTYPPQLGLPRRETMYRFIGGATDVNGDGSVDDMEKRMVPIDGGKLAATGNGFAVTYGVGAIVCHIRKSDEANIGKPQPTYCSTKTEEDTDTDALTFVGVGSVPGESARATLTQTIGAYNILHDPPGKPPIVASGGVDVTGGIQVVTNPNSAGPGVPVSVWTRKNMDKTGTPNTCYSDEFFRFGAQNSNPPIFEGTNPQIVTCDTCGCDADHSLSYETSGNKAGEGIDILDCETCNGDVHEGVNSDLKPNEFPCDLFQYMFGTQAYTDQDSDFFCETPIQGMTPDDTGALQVVGRDEQFLYEESTVIIPRDSFAKSLINPEDTEIGSACPDKNSFGLVWVQDQSLNCFGSNTQVGTPDKPVFLVIDGPVALQGRIFGLVYVRTVNPVGGATPVFSNLDPKTGGTDQNVRMNAGAVIYGAMVVQGSTGNMNGTAAVVYNADVLNKLKDEDVFNKFGSVPGGWTDRFSY